MNNYFYSVLAIVLLITMSHETRSTSYFSDNEKILDFSGVFARRGCEESNMKDVLTDVRTQAQQLAPARTFNEILSKIEMIDLSKNLIYAKTLDRLIKVLKEQNIWDHFRNIKLIYLQSNPLSPEAAPSLVSLLALYNGEHKNIFPYIHMVNTRVENSNIFKIAQKLYTVTPDVFPEIMSHLVFMKKKYIWHAMNRVACYHEMVSKKELPENWASRQQQYYSSTIYKNLVTYQKEREQKKWLNLINPLKSSEDPLKDKSEEEIKELAAYIGNLHVTPTSSPRYNIFD